MKTIAVSRASTGRVPAGEAEEAAVARPDAWPEGLVAVAGQAMAAMVRSMRHALASEEFDPVDELVDPLRVREASRDAQKAGLFDDDPAATSPLAMTGTAASAHAAAGDRQASPPQARPAARRAARKRVNPVRRDGRHSPQRRKAARAWRIVAWGVALLSVIALVATFWLVSGFTLLDESDDAGPEPAPPCRDAAVACRR